MGREDGGGSKRGLVCCLRDGEMQQGANFISGGVKMMRG